MDPNREKLRTMAVLKLPFARQIKISQADQPPVLVKVTSGKNRQDNPVGKHVLTFEVTSNKKVFQNGEGLFMVYRVLAKMEMHGACDSTVDFTDKKNRCGIVLKLSESSGVDGY